MKARIPSIVAVGLRQKRKMIRWATRFACLAGVWILTKDATVFASAIQGVEVHPANLMVDAMLNEPRLLEIEITSESTLGDVDLVATGLKIQREIKSPAPNRRVFLIEPDTSRVGRINGSIAVVERNGTTLYAVPVSGEVKPYVRVSPTRFFVGALEYGTTSGKFVEKRFRLSSAQNWKITAADVSDIPQAKVEESEIDAKTKELRLTFPEDALKAGRPFGAFINKTVRVRTNIAAQPEVVVPVIAMLSKNATDRNFDTFVFKGNERWQGKWGTPNIAAAVVGSMVLLALGYGAWFLRRNSRYNLILWGIGSLLCIGALVGMFFLVKTYSRGGWVAFGLGLASLILLMKEHRRILALGAMTFIMVLLASPAGAQRAASAAAVAEDASIRNRLLVWRGALEMIAENPIRGVGPGRFGEVFQNYYQEPWHKASYSTAINDYLTFAAERGLVVFLMIASTGIFLVAVSVQILRRHGDSCAAPIGCAVGTLGVSSLFSSIHFVTEVQILVLSSALILTAYSFMRVAFRGREGQPIERNIALRGIGTRSLVAATVTASLVGCLVAWAYMTKPVRHILSASTTGAVIEYRPGKVQPRGTVLFLSEEPEALTVLGRKVLRPFAQNGWRAMAMELPAYDQDATMVVADQLRGIPEPLIIVAEKTKARIALNVARNASQRHRIHLAFIEPTLFSSLPEYVKSHPPGTQPGPFATIDVKEWETFKQDSRTGSRVIEVLYALARVPESSILEKRMAASHALRPIPTRSDLTTQ